MQLALAVFSPPISRKALHFVSSVRHPDKNTPPNWLIPPLLCVFLLEPLGPRQKGAASHFSWKMF